MDHGRPAHSGPGAGDICRHQRRSGRADAACDRGRGDHAPVADLVEAAELAPGVKLLTLARPQKLNAMSWLMVSELRGALEAVRVDPTTRVLVLTGSGRGFCAGIDMDGADAVGSADGTIEVYERQERFAELAVALHELPQPVIAAVNGPAAGGGMALALACDVRLCSTAASFSVAFVRLGLSGCDVGVSYLLPRLVGLGIASELMLTGRRVDAEEAYRVGLANSLHEPEHLLDAAADLAAQMARNAPFALQMTRQVLHQNVDAGSLRTAVELENRTQVLATRTEDMKEALAAFRARREPSYRRA
ncbi:MAG: enoyl-CoA hydratase/isomerase family protein [Actinobacteria bacterium]|nr:enoyl-CoA hydratase/isomerase family protein [Actinomycetota bacterium]